MTCAGCLDRSSYCTSKNEIASSPSAWSCLASRAKASLRTHSSNPRPKRPRKAFPADSVRALQKAAAPPGRHSFRACRAFHFDSAFTPYQAAGFWKAAIDRATATPPLTTCRNLQLRKSCILEHKFARNGIRKQCSGSFSSKTMRLLLGHSPPTLLSASLSSILALRARKAATTLKYSSRISSTKEEVTSPGSKANLPARRWASTDQMSIAGR
mmetsp:Transcript_49041/g.104398  ORF Transcript_49041/g.104398 Transcript_49041/m.104398 type:complete len:213 (-) Transcript_49041:244-882(-)